MKPAILLAAAALMLPGLAAAQIKHFSTPPGPNGPPPFSTAVMVGNTLYVSGTTDGGFKAGDTNSAAAKRVMDNIKRSVEAGGLTMNDLVWVQVFCSDLAAYAEFNAVYRTYFTGPLPARAFLGTNALLNGSRFEVMGIAAKP